MIINQYMWYIKMDILYFNMVTPSSKKIGASRVGARWGDRREPIRRRDSLTTLGQLKKRITNKIWTEDEAPDFVVLFGPLASCHGLEGRCGDV